MLHLDIHNDWAFTDSGDLPRHIVNAWDGLRRVLTHRTAAWREVKQHLIATFITLCPQPT